MTLTIHQNGLHFFLNIIEIIVRCLNLIVATSDISTSIHKELPYLTLYIGFTNTSYNSCFKIQVIRTLEVLTEKYIFPAMYRISIY
jgi:hypothetical protein